MLVGSSVLFHVVFTREGFVALRAERVFLTSVFLGVTRGVARGGEKIGASVLFGHRTGVLVFFRSCLR